MFEEIILPKLHFIYLSRREDMLTGREGYAERANDDA
jgi:hypothetical protein